MIAQGLKSNRYGDMKIVGFPDKVKSFGSGEITAPVCVRVKPINRCSHSCYWCVYSDGTKRKGDNPDNHVVAHMHEDMVESDIIPTGKMLEVLDDFHEMSVKAVTYSGGGEPLMHPDIVTIMGRTLYHGINLSIITNGQQLLGGAASVLASAKWVRVSMDYTNSESMVKSRAVPATFYGMVMNNLRKFAAMKSKDTDLGVNFIITRENSGFYVEGATRNVESQPLISFARTLKEHGVENVRFSPMYTPEYEEYHRPHQWHVEAQLASDEMRALCDDTFSVNSTFDLASPSKKPVREYHKCFFMQVVPVLGADMNVYACHNKAYDKTGMIGSVKDKRFKEMWFSAEAKAVFDGLDPMVTCRHECANDAKNKVMHALAVGHVDNFV